MEKTMLEDLLEKYPNIETNKDGIPTMNGCIICPSHFGIEEIYDCISENISCVQCWNRLAPHLCSECMNQCEWYKWEGVEWEKYMEMPCEDWNNEVVIKSNPNVTYHYTNGDWFNDNVPATKIFSNNSWENNSWEIDDKWWNEPYNVNDVAFAEFDKQIEMLRKGNKELKYKLKDYENAKDWCEISMNEEIDRINRKYIDDSNEAQCEIIDFLYGYAVELKQEIERLKRLRNSEN
jgi:hypothetical protein